MDSSKKKGAGKSPIGEKDRIPLFFKELQERCKENNVKKLVIPAIITSAPKFGQTWPAISLMDKISVTTYLAQSFVDETINVYIAFQNFEKSGIVSKIYMKNEILCCCFITSLCYVMLNYDQITTLKLEYCKIPIVGLEILHSYLLKMPNLVELSLDGTPNDAQNHGLLIENTQILYLSLKRCKLSEIGIELICVNLKKCVDSKLQILNLTGNYIDDICTLYLEKMLRENRKLKSLILADNWITDAGCAHLMNPFKVFILTQDEIEIKRVINFEYFREKMKWIEKYKSEKRSTPITDSISITSKSAKKPRSRSTKSSLHFRRSRSTSTKRSRSRSRSSRSKFSRKTSKRQSFFSITSMNSEEYQMNLYIEKNLPKSSHPFVADIFETPNHEINCIGNFSLGFLNLAYNKISTIGYKHIIDTLNYQLTPEFTKIGLMYIVLNGNQDLTSVEFEEITRLILEKHWKLELQSNPYVALRPSNPVL